MIGKHYRWHIEWQRLPNGRLRHSSGAEFDVRASGRFTDVVAAPETLGAFQDAELARGVRVADLQPRLLRLAREAGRWLEHENRRER